MSVDSLIATEFTQCTMSYPKKLTEAAEEIIYNSRGVTVFTGTQCLTVHG